MQGSGGALLAAGLDGGNTLLCAKSAKATSPFRRTSNKFSIQCTLACGKGMEQILLTRF